MYVSVWMCVCVCGCVCVYVDVCVRIGRYCTNYSLRLLPEAVLQLSPVLLVFTGCH